MALPICAMPHTCEVLSGQYHTHAMYRHMYTNVYIIVCTYVCIVLLVFRSEKVLWFDVFFHFLKMRLPARLFILGTLDINIHAKVYTVKKQTAKTMKLFTVKQYTVHSY